MATDTQRGRPDINEVIEYLRASLGDVPMDGTQQQNRNNCKLLLDFLSRQYPGYDPVAGAKRMIDLAMGDGWHKGRCTNVQYLYWNRGKIIALGVASKPKEEPKQPPPVVGQLRQID